MHDDNDAANNPLDDEQLPVSDETDDDGSTDPEDVDLDAEDEDGVSTPALDDEDDETVVGEDSDLDDEEDGTGVERL